MHQLPHPQVMYKAFLERDSQFNGVFFVAVKTTKIFCRPICPARKPKRSNIEFFPDAKAALFAGYRSCKRCKPLQTTAELPETLRALMRLLDNEGLPKLREQDLRERGLEPSTVRRQFQKHLGMTFHQYQRARRMGTALHELRSGESVVTTQQSSGYQSAAGFWKSFRQLFGDPPSEANQVRMLAARWIETPLGAMLAIADDEGLHLLEFVDRRALETEVGALRKKTGCVISPGDHPYLSQIAVELEQYFAGERLEFETPIVLHGSPFENSVWQALCGIPVGETKSYQDMARQVGRPKAVRAVGRTNGKNCLAIIVPCHRVVGANGKLTGYGGGLWRKQWLLDHEAKES